MISLGRSYLPDNQQFYGTTDLFVKNTPTGQMLILPLEEKHALKGR